MPEPSPSFRDFGILPKDLPAPPDRVRCFFSRGRVVGQYIATGLVATVGLALAVLFALTMAPPLSLLACAAVLAAFGAFVYLATHNDYRWVELEGNTLRAGHLYTGRVIERSVEEIDCLGTMVYQVRRAATVVMEKLQGRVRGIEIRFRDRRTPLRIMRADPAMTNAQEMIEAVVYRMGQMGELDAQVVSFNGQPLVRHIHWKGEQPSPPPGKILKASLVCLIILALLFGVICGYMGLQEQESLRLGSVPPQVIPLELLIQNGPGDNRHITLTSFRPGGYTVQMQNSSWSHVWIALFPASLPPEERKEIPVVLESNAIRDEAGLRTLVQQGRVTGICSRSPRSGWGTELGPKLVQANHGLPLSSTWDVQELRELPSAERVTGILATSAGLFTVVLVMAIVVFCLKS